MESGIREGFKGQRMRVVPSPVAADASTRPGTARMLVTDIGWFPRAARHRRVRRRGIPAAIVMVCQRGAGWVGTEEGAFAVAAGQVVVLPPGVPHEYGADADDPWSIWWLHATGSDVPELVAAARFSAAQPVATVRHVDRFTRLVEEAFDRIDEDDGAPNLLAAAAAAWHLFGLLPTERRDAERAFDPVARAKQYMLERLPERTPVAEVAAAVGLSASHLSALFRAEMGHGLLRYQTRQRMARATELLSTTEEPIAVIAHKVGYDDELYFSRQFRHTHGVGPRAYRRSLATSD